MTATLPAVRRSPGRCELKSLPLEDLEVKVKEEDDGFRLKGYASIFNTKDFYKDIVRPKSFKKTIKERKKRIKVLYQHEAPAGVPTLMEEQEKGLWTESLLPFTDENRERMEYVKAGAVDGLSIGFIAEEFDYIQDEDDEDDEDDWFFFWPTREITKIMLLEYSLVTIPAHDDARLVGNQKKFALQQLLLQGGRKDLATGVVGAPQSEVSPDLLDDLLGYLGAIYKGATGEDYQMPVLTPEQMRESALNWKHGNTLWTPAVGNPELGANAVGDPETPETPEGPDESSVDPEQKKLEEIAGDIAEFRREIEDGRALTALSKELKKLRKVR